MEPLPMACSLGGSELMARYRELAAFGRADLIARSTSGDEQRLRFRRGPGTEKRLQAIIAAERQCCPFLVLDLVEDEDELELRIAAPGEGRPVAEQLAAAFG